MDSRKTALQTKLPAKIIGLAFLLVSVAVQAAKLQDGFNYTNRNNTSGRISVSFSGEFANGDGPVCLIPTDEIRIWPDRSRNFTPPAGFTVSDVVIFWTRRVPLRDANGNFRFDQNGNLMWGEAPTRITNIDDPPGADLPEIELRFSASDRVYNYLYIAKDVQVGPVVTTVPIVVDGTEANGAPKLYVAEQDPATGLPIINGGAGHCYKPTMERANDPATGEVLPKYLYTGALTHDGLVGPVKTAGERVDGGNNLVYLLGLFMIGLIIAYGLGARARK